MMNPIGPLTPVLPTNRHGIAGAFSNQGQNTYESPAEGKPVVLWGNAVTMNLEATILHNVQETPYFKDNLSNIFTFEEIVDEIYYHVNFLAPYVPNSGKVPSSAYCLLYKLFLLRISEQQLTVLLTHQDSPYIRAVGFMFVRYCTEPKKMWLRCNGHLDDAEEVKLELKGDAVTMGVLVRKLLLDQYFSDTILPRVPIPIAKDLAERIEEVDHFNPPPLTTLERQKGKKPTVTRRSPSPPSPRGKHKYYKPVVSIRGGEIRGFDEADRERSRKYHDLDRPKSRSRSPVRKRSRSPRRRSRSPRRRSRSPRRRSRSPRRRSRSRSPRRRRRSRSPRRRRSRSPRRRSKGRKKSRSLSPTSLAAFGQVPKAIQGEELEKIKKSYTSSSNNSSRNQDMGKFDSSAESVIKF